MSETVSVIIATFGDRKNWDRIVQRAINSVITQSVRPNQLIRSHGKDLQQARNEAVKKSYSDWLCFLDADDELEPGYIEAMLKGQGDLRYPMVRYLDVEQFNIDHRLTDPVALKEIHILDGNWMVIGTFVRREQFLRVGGFPDYSAYEDWALWIKCWIDGAQWQLCNDAIYRVYRSKSGRNHMPGNVAQKLHDDISGYFRPIAKERGLI
jgi:glycosyltransferase involved in cell wall biosynthesis